MLSRWRPPRCSPMSRSVDISGRITFTSPLYPAAYRCLAIALAHLGREAEATEAAAGVRVYDISDQFRPVAVGALIADRPALTSAVSPLLAARDHADYSPAGLIRCCLSTSKVPWPRPRSHRKSLSRHRWKTT